MRKGLRIGRRFVPKMWLKHPGCRGTAIEMIPEIVAVFGGAKSLWGNQRRQPGERKRIMAPFPLGYHQLPPDRNDHAYLRFRDRIGHKPRAGRIWPKSQRHS